MPRHTVHPIHYVLGIIPKAPTLLPWWFREDIGIKIGMFVTYLYTFSALGFFYKSFSGAIIGGGMYVVMVAVMTIPTMFFDTRKGDFDYRLSSAFFNATVIYHAYFMMHFLVVSILNYLMIKAHITPFMWIKSMTALTSGFFAMCSMQMAESMHSNVKPWRVLITTLVVTGTVYFGAEFAMIKAVPELGK